MKQTVVGFSGLTQELLESKDGLMSSCKPVKRKQNKLYADSDSRGTDRRILT